MVTQYGSFPGVQVEVAGGGITAVAIGEEEKLVLFGEASYQDDGTITSDGDEDALESGLTGTLENPEQIDARRQADANFGSESELADAMRDALANGANIAFLYGVAPRRYNVVDEVQSTQSGSLSNNTVWEEDVSDESNISALEVTDSGSGTVENIRYTYESTPTSPTTAETVVVNPLTGEYVADAAPDGDYNFSYKYLDWNSAFTAKAVSNVVNEDETAVFNAISDSDNVSSQLDSAVDSLRRNYQLVNGMSGAEPNTNDEVLDASDNYLRSDARFDTSAFTQNSVDSDYYFKLAPVRSENSSETVLGAVGGLFAGNSLNDPIYNDQLIDVGTLEQQFTKDDAENMRLENVIPIRQAGTVRVKDNKSTSTADDPSKQDPGWERDFWRRRIADRVILISKTIGDTILGRINDQQTRDAAARLIRAELRELVDDRLLRANAGGESNWYVDVYSVSGNSNEVKIDVGFTPYGIVKRIDVSLTINT